MLSLAFSLSYVRLTRFHSSPDRYYVNAMWHVLALARAAASSNSADRTARRVIFHVFSQPPPRKSWTGRALVPLSAARGAEYIDELGCPSSLRDQLRDLAGPEGSGSGAWDVRMHLSADPVQTILHMAKAHALIASDSSFSLIAAVLSRGLVLSRGGWKRFGSGATSGMLHHLALEDDGSFDCRQATTLWRAIDVAQRSAR